MKVFRKLSEGMVLCALFSILTMSCVNHITEGGDEIINSGNIPLKFVGHIKEVTHTRVLENEFEEMDTVGLFALAGTTSMKEERYVDNQFFTCNAEGEFDSDSVIYYPEDGVTMDLISYYPYKKEGVAVGKSLMQVSVSVQQNDSKNYSFSDFLVAYQKKVLPTKEALNLTYKHKFFKLKIALLPGDGEQIENMLTLNPTPTLNGFYTKADYDFQEDTFLRYSEEKTMTFAGGWSIEDERIVGKEVILIPQTPTVGYQYINLDVAGKTYTTFLPASLNLQGGKQLELEILFKSSEKVLMSKVKGKIDDWEGAETDQVESETSHKFIDVSKLSFEQSNVYKVLYDGKQVAEICKEYLVTPDLSSQAIVAYPVKAGSDHTIDLSKGKVVQFIGQSGTIHGGTVAWNMQSNSMTYTSGSLAAQNYVSVLKDGTISLSISAKDDPLPVLSLSDIVRDVRGGVIYNYPIVKIGTQYWMRENLKSTLYNDGTEIAKLDTIAAGDTGYLLSSSRHCFYSVNAVLKHEILPGNWSLPDWNDWDLLKAYLKNDATVLKSGEWVPLGTGISTVFGGNNKSGFNALPIGMYSGKFQSAYEGKYLSYWTLNDTGDEMHGSIFLLKSDTKEFCQGTTGLNKAYAIRCIRK